MPLLKPGRGRVYRRVRVITGHRRRRIGLRRKRRGSSLRALQPEANISEVARRNSVSRGLLNVILLPEGVPPQHVHPNSLGNARQVILRAPRNDPFQNVDQPSFWIESIEFAGIKKRRQDCPGLATADVATEKTVLFSNCDRTDRALHRIRMCALPRCTVLPGENPGRRTLAPAGSTRGGSGGDE